MNKRIEDLTREELLNLTEEDKATIISLEAAFEGITYVPMPEETLSIPAPKKSVVHYSIKDWATTDNELATTILDILLENSHKLVNEGYDYNFDYNLYYSKPADQSPAKVVINVMDEAEFRTHVNNHTEAKKLVKKNENLWASYNKYADSLDKLSTKLSNAVQDAHDIIANEARVKKIYAHYFELSGQSREVALRFFSDGQSDDDIKLLEKLNPDAFLVGQPPITTS